MSKKPICAQLPALLLIASPAFAPQVAKILTPHKWLTVEQVRAAGVFAGAGT